MAGHSKWSNIKARKGAQDKKRAKIFSRVIKEITIAIKDNGNNGEPETNPALRNAIQNARGANLPKITLRGLLRELLDQTLKTINTSILKDMDHTVLPCLWSVPQITLTGRLPM